MDQVHQGSQVFTVTVEPSGRAFSVPGGDTLLSAAIGQAVGLPYGCRDGACGSCKCKKLSGDVAMAPAKALSEQEAAAGFILTCRAVPLSDVVLQSIHVTAAGAFPVRKMPARVSTLTRLSPDVMQIVLQLPANDTMQYHAGQYVDMLLRDGSRRSYSMAGAPTGAASMELHVRHMPGGKFTDVVFSSMKERDILRLEGPFGSFYLRESDKPMIFLASGTGFAPIKALIEHMVATGVNRAATLYWGGRRPHDIYMGAWVRSQMAFLPNLRFIPVVSDAQDDDQWTGRTGFVHRAVLEDHADLSGYQVYACGAPVVVESAQRDFVALASLPADEFFADAFTTEADKAATANPQAAPAALAS